MPEIPHAKLDTASVRVSLADLDPAELAGLFCDDQEISPIRVATTQHLACNPAVVALKYTYSFLESDRTGEAEQVLGWIEENLRVVVCPRDYDFDGWMADLRNAASASDR